MNTWEHATVSAVSTSKSGMVELHTAAGTSFLDMDGADPRRVMAALNTLSAGDRPEARCTSTSQPALTQPPRPPSAGTARNTGRFLAPDVRCHVQKVTGCGSTTSTAAVRARSKQQSGHV
jgi:hypothetical protein